MKKKFFTTLKWASIGFYCILGFAGVISVLFGGVLLVCAMTIAEKCEEL